VSSEHGFNELEDGVLVVPCTEIQIVLATSLPN